MSVFDSQNQSEEQVNYVSKLVETRGEQWSDPEVIAKGKLEADQHIENLERQLAEMREDLDARSKLEDIAKALEDKAGASSSPQPQASIETAEAKPDTTSEADIESLVEKTLLSREAATKAQANVAAVDKAMQDKYGDKASEVAQAKAKELGMTLERLGEIAAESPQAFLAMVGESAPKSFEAPRSSVNTAGMASNVEERNFSYYQKMRRENPKLYYQPKTQNALMQDRVRLGSNFY